MTEQCHRALPPVVAGVAVLEAINALQSQASGVVAGEAQTADGDRVVEQLQILGGTGRTGLAHAGIAGLQAVVP